MVKGCGGRERGLRKQAEQEREQQGCNEDAHQPVARLSQSL